MPPVAPTTQGTVRHRSDWRGLEPHGTKPYEPLLNCHQKVTMIGYASALDTPSICRAPSRDGCLAIGLSSRPRRRLTALIARRGGEWRTASTVSGNRQLVERQESPQGLANGAPPSNPRVSAILSRLADAPASKSPCSKRKVPAAADRALSERIAGHERSVCGYRHLRVRAANAAAPLLLAPERASAEDRMAGFLPRSRAAGRS